MRRAKVLPLMLLAVALACGLQRQVPPLGEIPECTVEVQDCALDAGSCINTLGSDGRLVPRCLTGECDLVKQDCPASNKCTYLRPPDGGAPYRGCTPEGFALEGEPCSATASSNTCRRQLTCTGTSLLDGGALLACSRFCHRSLDCAAGFQCTLDLTVEGSIERPRLCAPIPDSCDLLKQDCAEANQGCYLQAQGPRCLLAGSVEDGSPCSASNDCVEASACVNGHCTPLCAYPSGDPSCAAGSCVSLQRDELPEAGACL